MSNFTTPRSWTAGETVTDTEMNTDIRDNMTHVHDWLGELGYNQRTTDLTLSGSFSTVCTAPVTVPTGGRNVKVTAALTISSTIDGDKAIAQILMDSTVLRLTEFDIHTFINPATNEQTLVARVAAPASGAHNFLLQAKFGTGAGTATMRASSTFPAFILVESL